MSLSVTLEELEFLLAVLTDALGVCDAEEVGPTEVSSEKALDIVLRLINEQGDE